MSLRLLFLPFLLAALLAGNAMAQSAESPRAPELPDAEATDAADEADAAPATAAPAAAGQLSLDDIRTFTAVLSLVKQAYVESVDDHTLMLGAIRGMLVSLDPHSEYLEASALHQLTEDTAGSYDGLGIEVTTVEGALRVIAPIDDTPAARAGIKPGDTILRIDNVPVLAENLSDAV